MPFQELDFLPDRFEGILLANQRRKKLNEFQKGASQVSQKRQ
jgi:hypothetical protein